MDACKAQKLNDLADFIEQVPADNFDMSNWLSKQDEDHDRIFKPVQEEFACGTVACIAGWTVAGSALFAGKQFSSSYVPQLARELLGLTEDEARKLFVPNWSKYNWYQITNNDAAIVLRSFAKTGIVDWDILGDRFGGRKQVWLTGISDVRCED